MERNVSFAVAAGGHSSNINGSNIDHGITVDLSSLSEVTLTDSDKAVFLGLGARWSKVYETLEPHELTVAGGRIAHVGVGGYVLGGGFSWFANQEGWCCDSVLEFELVTPDLRILRVDASAHEDLYWGLKGSLGALGIVTRIKMRTIPNLGIYAGGLAYVEEALPALFAALKTMANDAETDLYTSGYLSYAYIESLKDWTYVAYLVNTQSQNESATLANFESIPHIHSNLRQTTIRDSAEETSGSNPLGFRRSKFTITTAPQIEMMDYLHQALQEMVKDITLDPNSLLGVTYQPITIPHLRAQNKDSIFSRQSLSSTTMPLLLVSVELWWEDAERDAEFEKDVQALEDLMRYVLSLYGWWHPWLYPNYAAAWQDPFQDEILGAETMDRLRGVREEYDPDDVWKRLRPGIWHV